MTTVRLSNSKIKTEQTKQEDRANQAAVKSDDLAAKREKILVSLKEKAAILRHLQTKDLIPVTDTKEIDKVLVDLDKTIKELEGH